MTHVLWVALILILAVAGSACQPRVELRRPDVLPARMIEPQLQQSLAEGRPAPDATHIRLLDTQALGHIGRRVLHQKPGGELVEDPIWRWSSAPDRYLDLALRRVAASSKDVCLVDTGSVTAMGVTLIVWQLESAGSTQLVGAVELGITAPDRTVRTEVLRGSEAVSPNLPGDLAAAAGRLLNTLATKSLATARERSSS
jgi:hypothetical protein